MKSKYFEFLDSNLKYLFQNTRELERAWRNFHDGVTLSGDYEQPEELWQALFDDYKYRWDWLKHNYRDVMFFIENKDECIKRLDEFYAKEEQEMKKEHRDIFAGVDERNKKNEQS